jgi:hypothetical protein
MDNNLYCGLCEYKTDRPTDFVRHLKSKLHQRGGVPKTNECKKCHQILSTHHTLKHHMLTNHSTKEERSKSKYYCDTCDNVFIAKLYYDKHMNGIKHKNQVYIKQSLIEIQNKLNEKNI